MVSNSTARWMVLGALLTAFLGGCAGGRSGADPGGQPSGSGTSAGKDALSSQTADDIDRILADQPQAANHGDLVRLRDQIHERDANNPFAKNGAYVRYPEHVPYDRRTPVPRQQGKDRLLISKNRGGDGKRSGKEADPQPSSYVLENGAVRVGGGR